VTVQWSLGWAYEVADQLYERKGYPLKLTIVRRSPNYIVLIAIGVIFLIIGAILLTCTVKARRNNRDLVNTDNDADF